MWYLSLQTVHLLRQQNWEAQRSVSGESTIMLSEQRNLDLVVGILQSLSNNPPSARRSRWTMSNGVTATFRTTRWSKLWVYFQIAPWNMKRTELICRRSSPADMAALQDAVETIFLCISVCRPTCSSAPDKRKSTLGCVLSCSFQRPFCPVRDKISSAHTGIYLACLLREMVLGRCCTRN